MTASTSSANPCHEYAPVVDSGASLSPWPRKSNDHTRRPAATSRSATGAHTRRGIRSRARAGRARRPRPSRGRRARTRPRRTDASGGDARAVAQLAGVCWSAWSAIAFMIAFAARLTNSPPLPVTQSHDACGCVELTGEVRHDVLREQLEAALRRGGRRPVVPEQQERAEPARLVDERLDLGDRVVGRADHREAVLVDVGDDLRRGLAARRSRGQHVREVLRERHDAVLDVLARLLARLGEVHRPDEPPLRAVGACAVLVGDLVPRLPVRADRVEALLRRRRDREQAESVLARGLGAGRRDRRRDRDLEVRLAVRAAAASRASCEREPVGLHRDGLAAAATP